jgi:hypothetical protein
MTYSHLIAKETFSGEHFEAFLRRVNFTKTGSNKKLMLQIWETNTSFRSTAVGHWSTDFVSWKHQAWLDLQELITWESIIRAQVNVERLADVEFISTAYKRYEIRSGYHCTHTNWELYM